jgi:hypothetical protein
MLADGQKHSRSHEEASDEELQSLKNTGEAQALAPETSASDVGAEDPFKDVPVLFRTSAELYLFDTEADVFVIQEKEVTVDMASNAEYDSKC